MTFSSEGVAGVVACTLSFVLALFQFCLALGLPLGKIAWGGGGSEDLPAGFRIASLIASLVYFGFTSVLIQQSGFKNFDYSTKVCRNVTWFLTAFMFFETLLNFASRSPTERAIWTPYCLVFACSCLVLARKDDREGQEQDHLLSTE